MTVGASDRALGRDAVRDGVNAVIDEQLAAASLGVGIVLLLLWRILRVALAVGIVLALMTILLLPPP